MVCMTSRELLKDKDEYELSFMNTIWEHVPATIQKMVYTTKEGVYEVLLSDINRATQITVYPKITQKWVDRIIIDMQKNYHKEVTFCIREITLLLK
jgi:hypothetical protein